MSRDSFRQEINQKLMAIDDASGSNGEPLGVAFARDFLSYYAIDNAFGKAGKRNADAFLVHLMVKYGIISMSKPDEVYEAAMNLQVRDSYLKSLYYDAQMMFGDVVDPRARCERLVSLLFVNGTRKSALEDRKLIVSIDDQMLRNYVKAMASSNHDWSDSSFNSSIVKMPIDAFIRVVERAYDDAVPSTMSTVDNEEQIKRKIRTMMVEDMQMALKTQESTRGRDYEIAKKVLAQLSEADDADVAVVFKKLTIRYASEDEPQEGMFRKACDAISAINNVLAIGETVPSAFNAICGFVPLIAGLL